MLKVVCAIIVEDFKVLMARRSAEMKHPCQWEFPGGKAGNNETEENALKREIMEELNLEIRVSKRLASYELPNNNPPLKLIPYLCERKSEEINLLEHSEWGWFTEEELNELNMIEADSIILERSKKDIWS